DRVVHLAAGVAQVAAGHQPGGHAAAFPLHTGDAFEHLVVLQRVVVAADHRPAGVDRVQERQVHLLEQVGLAQNVAAVAVGEVDDAFVAHQVAGADGGQVLAAGGRVPLVGGPDRPAVVDRVVGVDHPGRL